MRLFGSDNISGLMEKLGMEEDMPIEHSFISKSIETAQKRVENRNFDTRKHVLEYDDVMNKQREVIYEQRRRVLVEESLKETIQQMIDTLIDNALNIYCNQGVHPEEWDLQGLLDYSADLFLPHHKIAPEDLADTGREEIRTILREKTEELYDTRERELGEETIRHLEKVILLRIVDEKWMDHLDAMDQLRQGIGLRAYGQKDPLVEYKFEGYEMFQNMISSIQEDVVRYIFRVNVVQEPTHQHQHIVENRYAEDAPKQPVRAENQIGRNDPCPCGSGKKYKKCCGQ
jgi:preprotein translocase subunit SecA